jgi:glycosyltransferase involved in cell wall biosynthesis
MKKLNFAVIAAKNEEANIFEVVNEARRYVNKVIVVDDGSTDRTKDKAEKAGAIVLEHLVNLGKGAAIKTGCEYAISKGANLIVLLDADGQHEPKDIPKFLQKLENYDIVFGIRQINKKMPLIFRLGNKSLNNISSLLFGINIPDSQCGFRAFKAEVYRKIKWKSSNYSMESEMIANVGRKKLKYSFVNISTIYSDNYKGTTIIDGVKIAINMLWFKVSR